MCVWITKHGMWLAQCPECENSDISEFDHKLYDGYETDDHILKLMASNPDTSLQVREATLKPIRILTSTP